MLFTKIKNSKVIFPDRKKYKIDFSDELTDLVTKLTIKDKSQRIGANGVKEVLDHPFFASINFQELEAKLIKPPFKPKIEEKDFTKFFNT